MSNSILTSVHAAVFGSGHEPTQIEAAIQEDAPDHSQPRSESMSENNGAPAANNEAGISHADHDAAVAKASADGNAEGMKAANDRMAAVLGAEGINGDGAKMAAALDLAIKSPGMSAEDVTGFVTAHAGGAPETTTAEYEQGRSSANTGLAMPQGGEPKATADSGLKPSSIYAKRRSTVTQ